MNANKGMHLQCSSKQVLKNYLYAFSFKDFGKKISWLYTRNPHLKGQRQVTYDSQGRFTRPKLLLHTVCQLSPESVEEQSRTSSPVS